MDTKKDIQIMSNTDKNKTSFNIQQYKSGYGGVGSTNFEEKGHNDFYKKTSNIMQAVFLITDSIEDSNALKVSLRKCAIDSLSLILDYCAEPGDVRSGAAKRSFMHMRALLAALATIRLVRQEYVSLLLPVIHDVERQLGERLSELTLTNALTQQGKEMADEQVLNRHVGQKNAQIAKGHVVSVSSSSTLISESKLNDKIKDRREIILNLVRDKGRVTVKDAQEIVLGVSSKTLQRELLGMVAEGVLKKEGERRWSVYMLRTNGNGGNGIGA